MADNTSACDVILLFPKTGMDFGGTVGAPHALLSIAAPLHKAGYAVKIIDQRINPDWRADLLKLLKLEPLCVGISVMTGSPVFYALEMSRLIKENTRGKTTIIWGGPHPSVLPEQTLENRYIDIVCIGEGDITFLELADALSNKRPLDNISGIGFKQGSKIVITPERPLLNVEELLPIPWELIEVEKYIHRDFYLKNTSRSLDIGQTSRGCPYQCGFCSSAALRKRKWRAMSVEKSLERILDPVRRFNLDSIWIRDDEFYIDRERAYAICKGIIASGLKIKWYTSGTRVNVFNQATEEELSIMKQSGADTVKFGAESGSNRILKLMNKGITVEETIAANLKAKRAGITPAFALMIGFPTETFAEIDQTIDLRFRLKKDNPQAQFETMAIYTALPGTEMWTLAQQHGLKPPQHLEEWIDWIFDDYDFDGKRTPWFSAKDRIKLGNITYMSILSNAIINAINSLGNTTLRNALNTLFKLMSKYYSFMLKHKLYAFAPELLLANYLRKKIFYKTNLTMH
jgi:anaerobic magnesium-protoporphyrin IX monomethyl ester cyclase